MEAVTRLARHARRVVRPVHWPVELQAACERLPQFGRRAAGLRRVLARPIAEHSEPRHDPRVLLAVQTSVVSLQRTKATSTSSIPTESAAIYTAYPVPDYGCARPVAYFHREFPYHLVE